MLLQDQNEILDFHESIARGEVGSMVEGVGGLSERAKSLLAKSLKDSEREGTSVTEAALDSISSELISDELASIPSQVREA